MTTDFQSVVIPRAGSVSAWSHLSTEAPRTETVVCHWRVL
jgi:hypothetical protein